MNSNVFNYPLMACLCQVIQEKAQSHSRLINCIGIDLKRFYFIFSGKHRSDTLFFCFDPPFVRFHFVKVPPKPERRFTHPILAFLKDAELKKAQIVQNDRILELTFHTSQGKRLFIGEFFSKHPNYYLNDHDGKILFALHPTKDSHYHFPKLNQIIPAESPSVSHEEIEQKYAELERQWKFSQEKKKLSSRLAQAEKKLRKKEQELLKNIQECHDWTTIQHEGDLIKFYLPLIKKGSIGLEVDDWLTNKSYYLTLDPAKTALEQMAERFKKAKKLQRGLDPLKRLLVQSQTELELIIKKQQELELIHDPFKLTSFQSNLFFLPSKVSSITAAPTKTIPYREYYSTKGVSIWVGKNAKANHQVTFRLANGRDWWLHAMGCSGSHVVIRLGKNEEPDQETLKDAMQLALYYSKARSQGEGEICLTQRKYVSPLKGRPGTVQISKHQKAWVTFDSERFQLLQERKLSHDTQVT